jgi:ABC-type bacteriocin/lantibiotic exporter with double-glycine peptidase domain
MIAMIEGNHWVTVIGVRNSLVYIIDYGGIYTLPLVDFKNSNHGVAVLAPGCLIAVSR